MKWGIAALAAALTLTAAAEEYKPSFFRYIYTLDQNLNIVGNGVFSTPVPRFAELEREQSRLQTYDQFLDYLFAKAPSLKEHFVLLHHSQSLQFASPEHPRAILFDGGVAFAISEHPENRMQRVEMMEADPITRGVNMREIIFSNGGVQFDANPVSCRSCHGQPAKPLWDPYDFWPNAFAGAAAAFGVRQEKEAYARLVQNAGSSPLLSRLTLRADLNLNNEEINGLTYFVTQIGYTRFWKQTVSGGELNGFKPALFAAMSYCFGTGTYEEQKPELLSYFPPGRLAPADLNRLDQIYADIVNSRAFTKKFQDGLVSQYFTAPDFISVIDHARLQDERASLAILRWLLDLGGVNAANMSISLLANDYLLSSPSNFMLDLLTTLYEARPEMFTGLTLAGQDLYSGQLGWISLKCEELKAQSLAAGHIPAQPQWRSYLSLQPERPVVSRCAKCHTESGNERIPKIEFHDSLTLARRIRTTDLGDKILARIQTTGRGQMPPGHPLSAEEITAMKEFIRAMR
jgi:cytochrome c553